MSQELLNQILVFLAGLAAGGAAALLAYDRAVKSILNSPVLITALQGAFASLPPGTQSALKDTSTLLDDVTGKAPASTQAKG